MCAAHAMRSLHSVCMSLALMFIYCVNKHTAAKIMVLQTWHCITLEVVYFLFRYLEHRNAFQITAIQIGDLYFINIL
jgi:hypothetical protein